MSMFSDSLRAFLKPVVPFLDDPEVSEVLINGPGEIWIEKRGKLSLTGCSFTEDGLLAAARNMAQYVGRPLTEERPRLDARLPDGSRIHVVLPPIARRGTTISIRKFFSEKLTLAKLLELGSLTPKLARLLEVLVGLRLNLVVAGGTGSGKTSLLNVLSQLIAPDERILTIEDSAELQLTQPHLVSFESRPADRLGKGAVDIGDLLHSALRLRPDRIIVGEVRGGECFHLLQAMNTGHGGTLTTAHANTAIETLRRIESLCLLSGVELPLRAVRAQVAGAVNVVICCERFPDGTRKITQVSEVLPLDEKGEYRVQDLFSFNQTARLEDGTVLGHFATTGQLPSFFRKLAPAGFGDLDERYFAPGQEEATLPRARAQVADTDPEQKAPGEPKPEEAPPTPTTLLERAQLALDQLEVMAPLPASPPVRAATRRTSPGDSARPPLRAVAPIEPSEPAQKISSEVPGAAHEPSIQLEAGLAAELERRLPTESTLITRNPLLESQRRRAPTDDDDTNPGTRAPQKPLR